MMFDCLALQKIVSLALVLTVTMASADINDFFPDLKGNLTKITWAHAVNNKTYLNDTLCNDNIMMIEADVVIGIANGYGEPEPIMAHPPANTSDLSLMDFLFEVKRFNTNETNTKKKGVKLDFKTIDAFLKSIDTVQLFDEGKYPIWINADIIAGPVKADTDPVDPNQFLAKSKSFSNSTLSIGWTTKFGNTTSGAYESEQITSMLDVIAKNNVTQEITFPVRAGLAAESIGLLVDDLLGKVDNKSTLTIWSSEGDNVNVAHLRNLIAKVGISKVYIDVPGDLLDQLHLDDLPNSAATLSTNMLGVVLSVLLGFIIYCQI